VKTRKNQQGKGKLVKVKIPAAVVSRLNALPVYPSGLWFWNKMTADAKHETATGNLRRKMRPFFEEAKVWLKDEEGQVVLGDDNKPKLGHLYQWRHSFVHVHLMNGTPTERIAEMIGDTQVTVVKNYAHFIEERQKGLDTCQESTFDADELAALSADSGAEDLAADETD
jgi:hypothetical protein